MHFQNKGLKFKLLPKYFIKTGNVCVIIVGLSLIFFSKPSSATLNADTIATKIREKYESELFTLNPSPQRHYALRMYRLTGNEKYIYSIVSDLMITANILRYDINALNNQTYLSKRVEKILGGYEDKPKSQQRKALLKQWGNMAFNLRLLSKIKKIKNYGLLGALYFEQTDKAIAFLKKVDFATFILDETVINIYAAQLANYVYYLYDLDILDLRKEFISAFRKTFPDSKDDNMSHEAYMAKIYGLTHIILAASDYYQHCVQRNEFEWVYRYFEKNIDRIIRDTKPDVFIEVGLCFLLAGDKDNAVLKKVKSATAIAFNPKYNMILSVDGDTDLGQGEHRNVLALMLFTWPDKLHAGPLLENFRQYNSLNVLEVSEK